MTPKDVVQPLSLPPPSSSSFLAAKLKATAISSSSSNGDPRHRLRQRLDIPTTTESSFSFGVIADVQWADEPDGSNYAKTVKRCYRGAFTTLQNAVEWWNDYNANNSNKPLQFIGQLGDLIDGLNQHKQGESDRVLNLALEEFNKIQPVCPCVNLVGNHELYNYNREQLSKAKWLYDGNEEYYSFVPAPGWKILVLDPYQISLIGHKPQEDPRRVEAVKIIQKENPNVSTDGASGDWFEGIEGYQRRFCPYNGGYGKQQLDWLKSELQDSAIHQQRVVIFSHVIVHPKACGGGTMAWDYDKALEIIHRSKIGTQQKPTSDDEADDENVCEDDTGSCCVVAAVFCGHDHKGNYHCDEYGIHHCTFSSPLNKGSDGYAFGIVQIKPNYMEIIGPKIDDFLPNVEGRPKPTAVAHENNDCKSSSKEEKEVVEGKDEVGEDGNDTAAVSNGFPSSSHYYESLQLPINNNIGRSLKPSTMVENTLPASSEKRKETTVLLETKDSV